MFLSTMRNLRPDEHQFFFATTEKKIIKNFITKKQKSINSWVKKGYHV